MSRNLVVPEFPVEPVAAAFKALAHPVRLQILEALRYRPCNISQLTLAIRGQQANVSKHVEVLARAGLVHRRRQGNRKVCWANSIVPRLWGLSGMNAAVANAPHAEAVFCPEI